MPQRFNYDPILTLASPPRMASFQAAFSPSNNSELYGVYIWVQHVVGALYPLTQHVEIALRNSIDKEARRRFNDFWWTLPQFNSPSAYAFQNNIAKAKANLDRDWKQAERKRRGLPPNASLPTAPPAWSHDKIVAATDFSTWEFVLREPFFTPAGGIDSMHLWPASLAKSFRRYDLLDVDPKRARKRLLDLIREIREYRNRLYHHDKIWPSLSAHMNAQDVINSIRHKINKMETLLRVIDLRLHSILEKTGVLANARRVCSLNDLDIYRFAHTEHTMTRRKKRVLRSITGRVKQQNITQAWTYAGRVYGLYQIR